MTKTMTKTMTLRSCLLDHDYKTMTRTITESMTKIFSQFIHQRRNIGFYVLLMILSVLI